MYCFLSSGTQNIIFSNNIIQSYIHLKSDLVMHFSNSFQERNFREWKYILEKKHQLLVFMLKCPTKSLSQ
jgi:hypothetical protein